jgi:putative DNA primase/helicase
VAGGGPDSQQLIDAALGYAGRGWPVFPCNPKNKQPLLGADKDAQDKPIRGTGGLKKASTDPEQIAAWWKRWPHALIGIACGHPTKGTESESQQAGLRLFVLDFDPRTDAETGEVFTLDTLKSETEAQIGCPLPHSMAALTPSDGVHLYLLIGDDGPSITNRGNLPSHVDVRGLGGYVIAPPSVMTDGRRYRWHRREPIGGIAKAPEALLEVLRDRGGKPALHSGQKINQPEQRVGHGGGAPAAANVDDAVRKYALAALDGELQAVRSAASGRRNAQLNESALKIASLVASGALEGTLARSLLEAAARDNPGRDDDRQLQATIDSGWSAGINNPRDLSEIAAAARQRSERRHNGRSGPSGPRPDSDRPAAAPSSQAEHGRQPFRSGKRAEDPAASSAARELTDSDRCRLKRIAEAWLTKRLEAEALTGDSMKRIAWGCGRRIAAGHLDDGATRERLWAESEAVAGITLDDLDRAIEDGFARGFDPAPTLTDLDCARFPLTDFGLAERFRDRFGAEFRFTTAKGWLGWDGRRWKVLDQDKDTPPAELIAAVFETIRLVQREARRIRETGTRFVLRKEGKREFVDEEGESLDAALDYWMPKGRSFVRYSDALAIFGRASEAAGKPASIAALARRWLTVPIEQFDCEQMAVNVINGTLRFDIEGLPEGKRAVSVRLDPHRREDLITRIAPVEYDREAPAPLYDAMIAWAQPDPAVRRYVHQVGGYASSGDTGEHLLWFNYGRGRNGKSVTIDSWCSALGDYSGTIGIESFLDQGIKKRGDAATPDLAKLGGVRMLRASEPERGAKLNSALIKAATGGEPMSVRALHRGFFDLSPRFKLLMSGNSKPGIPDTDDGIWGRMRLVPWKRHIEKPDEDPYRDTHPAERWPTKDPKLADKIKAAELAGVFARLVEGLVDYLEHGFVEPEGVTLATADYRNQSDPLGRFLELCTERVPDSRVKSSELHELFAAWCKAAGEKEWSPVGFANAMIDKGFTKVRSDGMRWEGLRMTRQVSDFVDGEGRVRLLSDDLTKEPARAPPAAASVVDDDLPDF